MYEFELELLDGRKTFAWGYSLENAISRQNFTREDVARILYQELLEDD